MHAYSRHWGVFGNRRSYHVHVFQESSDGGSRISGSLTTGAYGWLVHFVDGSIQLYRGCDDGRGTHPSDWHPESVLFTGDSHRNGIEWNITQVSLTSSGFRGGGGFLLL